jgi:hypothetical protein
VGVRLLPFARYPILTRVLVKSPAPFSHSGPAWRNGPTHFAVNLRCSSIHLAILPDKERLQFTADSVIPDTLFRNERSVSVCSRRSAYTVGCSTAWGLG